MKQNMYSVCGHKIIYWLPKLATHGTLYNPTSQRDFHALVAIVPYVSFARIRLVCLRGKDQRLLNLLSSYSVPKIVR